MNTISQSEILLQEATNEVGSFLRKYQVSDILKQCNGYKQKGFPVIQLFAYLVTLMFQPLSTYMSMRVGAYKEPNPNPATIPSSVHADMFITLKMLKAPIKSIPV